MNNLCIHGRISTEIKTILTSEKGMCLFSVACRNHEKLDDGTYGADFIPCIAYGSTANIISKNLVKGSEVTIIGRLSSGSYTTKDGEKRYSLQCVVQELDFCGSKKSEEDTKTSKSSKKTA